MKTNIRILALVLALGTVVLWFALGANGGWTKTSAAVKTIDEVTGIEGVRYEKKFVPGIDILGASLLAAGLLASTSLFFRNQQTKTN